MKRNIVIITAIIAALLISAYFGGAFFYKNKFLNNVYVNDINVGGMTLDDADSELAKADTWDKIIIKSDTEEFLVIEAEEIEYDYVNSPDLPKLFNDQMEWKWFLSFFERSDYTTPMVSDYNEDKIKTMIDGIDQLDKKLLNANIVYSESSNDFVIEPHSYEIKITKEELFDLVADGIGKREHDVNIEDHIEQPDLFEDDEAIIAARDQANQYLQMELVYDFGDREELVDHDILKDLIIVKGTDVEFDLDKATEYAADLAKKYDTYGTNRPFKTTTGKDITTNGGSYGWMIHRSNTAEALIEHIKAGENKTIEPVYSYKALVRAANDIGDSYVEIDLEEQMLYVYIEGKLKTKTQTVTGDISKGYDTPTGVFPINYKERDAVLRGEGYAAPVDYWVPFNGNIGIHDADWNSSFGGDYYKNNGSNGCINLPPKDTKAVFDLVYPGMPVIVH